MDEGLIECVPNFSEGRNQDIINEIANSITSENNVSLLDVDSSKDFNRTVFTFVGNKKNVLNAAINCTKKGLELIDMRGQKGEHARMGAVDVVPFIPISNSSMEECIELSNKFAKEIGENSGIPVYLYANAARSEQRKSLPNIRKGEYEGLKNKILQNEWSPDYGPQKFIPESGAMATGARSVLIAFNINLNTHDKTLANSIAGKIRTSGVLKKDESGNKILDKNGKPERIKGMFSDLQAAGWMYDKKTAQVSMNLLDFSHTGMHEVMEEIKKQASKKGLEVTAGELVGLVPLNAIIDSGRYYHSNPNDASIDELVDAGIEGLMLNKLNKFIPEKRIIEWAAK
ncbi:MAG: glutamate formimidoyltransferase [Euryarchaeota archaeon]|nr:glutamate formimidoyltransferase [Euryarchaeota archaeon]|tara:strand:- start:225 stop:1253 length:1029 start_codon:yes stop_codon:yes gene_type:complete